MPILNVIIKFQLSAHEDNMTCNYYYYYLLLIKEEGEQERSRANRNESDEPYLK
jgi:hypothetical protein